MLKCCDVLVVGGGAAGATAAQDCAKGGAKVIIAAPSTHRALIGECLSPKSRRLLTSIHPRLRIGAHARYVGTRSRWAREEVDETSFIFDPDGVGFRLDRQEFDQDLRQSAEDAGVTWGLLNRLISCDRRSDHWHVKFDNSRGHEEIRAGYVIDCSGRARLFARSIGVKTRIFDRMVGLLLISEADTADARLTIDAAPYGWWYSVVTPNGSRVSAFMTDADVVKSRGLREPGRLEAMCEEDGGLLGRYLEKGCSPVAAVPAATTRLAELAGEYWCAAGDAASTYDPLSSQGIVKAVETGRVAARAVLNERLDEYGEWLEDEFERYLATRNSYYAVNRRWPNSPFWNRRSG